MKELQILIIEDEPAELEQLHAVLRTVGHQVCGTASTYEEAKKKIGELKPDLVIIDIYLAGKPDGIVLGHLISERHTPFLFLTGSYDTTTFQLAKQAFPQQYLLKPYNPPELAYSIELAVGNAQRNRLPPEESVLIRKGNLLSKTDYTSIHYIEVEGKYSKIVCAGERFLIQHTLKDLLQELPEKLFFRIHRNYIVNLRQVVRINTFENEVMLKDSVSLPVSRRYLDNLLTRFQTFR